jgi:hypothetical protein
MYVASVPLGCFKSRSGVAHVAMCVKSKGDTSGPERGVKPGRRRGVLFVFCKHGRGWLVRARKTAAWASGHEPRAEL